MSSLRGRGGPQPIWQLPMGPRELPSEASTMAVETLLLLAPCSHWTMAWPVLLEALLGWPVIVQVNGRVYEMTESAKRASIAGKWPQSHENAHSIHARSRRFGIAWKWKPNWP